MSIHDPNKLRMIIHWLDELAVTVALPRDTDWKVVLKTYSDFLYVDFNSGAFNRDSLRVVASQNEFFPTYRTLHEQLHAWVKEHLPPLQPIALPAPPPPPPEDPYTFDDVLRMLEQLRDHPKRTLMLELYRAQLGRNYPAGLPMLDAFEAELPKISLATPEQLSEEAPPPIPAATPRYLSTEQLLAAYEAQGRGGTVRAAMLREQLRKPRLVNAD